MQHRLLQDELRSAEATLCIRQKIFESSLGHDPHHTAAITLVFEGLALSAWNPPIPFSTATAIVSKQGSHGLPDFAPHHGRAPDCYNMLTFQSISFMPQYQLLSHEVRSLKYSVFFGLKCSITGDQSPPLLWNAHPACIRNPHFLTIFYLQHISFWQWIWDCSSKQLSCKPSYPQPL